MALTKTIQAELLAITAIAAGAQQISSVIDVSTMYAGTIFIDHAMDSASPPAGSGTEYRIEVSEKATGNDAWTTISSVTAPVVTPVSIVTINTEAAASTLIECGAAVPTKGDHVFFKNATIGNSEWAKVASVASNQFTLQDGLTKEQAAGTYYNGGYKWIITLDLLTIKRLRVVVNNNIGSTNQAIVSRIALITTDSIS